MGLTGRPRPGPHWLLAAPHRLGFAVGCAALMLTSLAWAAVLAGDAGRRPDAARVATHAAAMAWSFLPAFFAGFVATAGPRWRGLPPWPARALLVPMACHTLGVAGLVAATLAPEGRAMDTLAAGSTGLIALAWARVCLHMGALLRHGRGERLHLALMLAASLVGLATMGGAAFARGTGDLALTTALARASLWGFAGVVFAAAGHRMIPFFAEPPSASAPRRGHGHRPWVLALLAGALFLQATHELGAVVNAPWAAGVLSVRTTALGAAAAALLALAWHWARIQSLRARLLRMLFGGFVWFGLALAAASVSQALESVGHGWLGAAPLHAFAMGALGSTMLAMVGRVSAGHGGRRQAADAWLAGCWWLLQAAVAVRMLAAMAADAAPWRDAAQLGAALLWAVVAWAWGLRQLGWYLAPRPDGRPG